MVISAQVLSVNVGGTSNSNNSNSNSNITSNNNKLGTKSSASDSNNNENSSPQAARISDGVDENRDQQQKNPTSSISPLVAETPSAAWFKQQQQRNWLLSYCTPPDLTTATQLTVLIGSISDDVDPEIAIPTTSDTVAAATAATTTTAKTSIEEDMSRESRHVHVIGLPDSLPDDRVSSFFSTFGRVQKVERLGASGVVVSFMDVRSAQKAHSTEPKFEGHQLRIAFHEQSKNGLVNSTVSSSTGLGSPQNTKNASNTGSTATDSHRRSSDLHSPSSSSSKQFQKERVSQHRVSSSSRRPSRERERDRERGSSSRADERSQRSRTSGNNERRIGGGGESRVSRRSRRSPKASDSSDSSRDSPSPSGSSAHHHHSTSTHTVQSTVIKLGTASSRRSDGSTSVEPSASCGTHDSPSGASQGMQGIYVTNLSSSRSESSLKDFLTSLFKKFGKVIHIVFEMESGPNFVEQRRALVIFQRLMDVDKLLGDNHHLLGLRLKIRLASHVAVLEAYNNFLAATSAQASGLSSSGLGSMLHEHSKLLTKEGNSLPLETIASTSSISVVDVLASRASRTLYVGGLERRTTDDSLRARFGHFGHILEIDVKNWESPSPFAFIQFADIQSVVRAINAYALSTSHSSGSKGKLKTNWGRTIVSNKIWIGEVPSSCSADYLREKIRVSFTETFSEVIYDPRYREALLLFVNNDSAQRAFSMIKTRQIAFWNADEKKDVHVPVDYCSEKLHDYFVDRKFRGESGNAPLNGIGPGACVTGSASACPGGGSAVASASTSSLLAPPPDPPSHLRDTSTRVDYRRSSSSIVSRRRRSNERESSRNASRSSRYSSAYNRSRRRRERARRNDISPSSSSTSTTSSDSDSSSRSSTPGRRRNDNSHSRNAQRSHRDKTPIQLSSSRQSTSPSSSRMDRNTVTSNTSTAPVPTTVVAGSGSNSSRASLAQLLPPPMPSAPILMPVVITSPTEKQQQLVQPDTESSARELSGGHAELKRQQSVSVSSSSVDNELDEGNANANVVQRSRKRMEHQNIDVNRLENRGSRDSGFYDSTMQECAAGNELGAITSNRIEEIANTLVNVLQHHSKASTSTTGSTPLDIVSGTHHSHSSSRLAHRSSDDACSSSRHRSNRPSTSSTKRSKWPWGNDPIKNHCAIPLDGTGNRDPRHRKQSPQSPISLPLPKFAHDRHSTPNSRRGSLVDSSNTSQKPDLSRQRNSISAAAFDLNNGVNNTQWGSVEDSPSHQVTSGRRTRSSTSRSESSNSEAMLSPDPSSSTTQPSLVASAVDIFGDSSPTNNSSAYRERLDALGATFQNIEQNFQKTKQNTHLDYDRKGATQRSYKFEEELERLKARSGSSGLTVSTPHSVSAAGAHQTANTFSDSFMKVRSSGSNGATAYDAKGTESQKSNRVLPATTISIPIPPPPVPSTAPGGYATAFSYPTSDSSSSLPSPQFASGQLRKPPAPPTITSSAPMPQLPIPSRVPFPPNFSIPPPPLPQPPVPPTLSTAPKPPTLGSSLISAPPPPPPMVTVTSSSHSIDVTSTSSGFTPPFPPLAVRISSQNVPPSSSWRTSAKPSTPPPPPPPPLPSSPHSTVNPKTPQPSTSASGTPKSSTSASLSGVTSTAESDRTRARPSGIDKLKEKEHQKTSNSKPHMHEKKTLKESSSKQPSLSELFRQQAQDSSEVRKKQLKKVKTEEASESKHQKVASDENKKGVLESENKKGASDSGKEQKRAKEGEKKEKTEQTVVRKEKKHGDGGQAQETKSRMDIQQKQQKEKKKEVKGKEVKEEAKKAERVAEKNMSKNKVVKDGVKQKEKEKAKEKEQREQAKKRQEEEKRRQKEREKEQERKKKEPAKKKRKGKVESSSSSDEETSSSETELHSFDRELKRLFMEEEASGSLGLSMYDRVKQRSSWKPGDAAKKNRALELLQERTQSRRNYEQHKRPKRVQVESSSSDGDKDSSNDELDDSSDSSVAANTARNKKKKKTEQKSKTKKKAKAASRKKSVSVEETESEDDDEEVEKESESTNSDEEEEERPKGRRTRRIVPKSKKQKKKVGSLSLDDVFGAYSTDDESTKHSQSRGSIVPSLYKEKDEKEESSKKSAKKVDVSQKSKKEKEKADDRSVGTKKDRRKEKVEASDEDETVVDDKKTAPQRTPQKVDKAKQNAEKSSEKIEKKTVGKKRPSKDEETVGTTGAAATSGMLEKKKQKTEKSLVEISMFKEEAKKPATKMAKTSITSEQKRTAAAKGGTNEQFEKKLAKKLRKEQKEREEEQKREVDEAKRNDEKQDEQSLKLETDKDEGTVVADVSETKAKSPGTSVKVFKAQSCESSVTIDSRKRHLEVESSGKVKRSRKMTESEKSDSSDSEISAQIDSKTTSETAMEVVESPSRSPKKRGRKSKDDNHGSSVVGSTNSESPAPSACAEGTEIPQSTEELCTPAAETSIPCASGAVKMEVESVVEECEKDTELKVQVDSESPQNLATGDGPDPQEKPESVGQEAECRESKVMAVAVSAPGHSQEDAHLDEQQRQHADQSDDDDEEAAAGRGGKGRNVGRDVAGRRNSVSSTSSSGTSSSESSHTSTSSSCSSSSANLETQLEDGPEEKQQQQQNQIPESNDATNTVMAPEAVKKTESDGKPNVDVSTGAGSTPGMVHLTPMDRINFVPSSDAECSAVSMVHDSNIAISPKKRQSQQRQDSVDSSTSVLDNVNDAESNGSFELIDEGRVGGDDESLLDEDGGVDDDVDSEGQQRSQQQQQEQQHQQQQHQQVESSDDVENVELQTVQHADDSECTAVQDVHDVQETEFAVQSIALLDDTRSQQSGEDGSVAMDYLSESGGGNSRRSSLVETVLNNLNVNVANQEYPHDTAADAHNGGDSGGNGNDNDDNGGNGINTPKPLDTQHQETEPEGSEDGKSKTDADDKRSDSHLDEVIDDVVAGGYMEVDAEQLMRINSKKAKEEAVLRAAAAATSQHSTPKAPQSAPCTSYATTTDTSQQSHYDYPNATGQGSLPPHHVHQYGSSYPMQQQQMPMQQGVIPQQQPQQNIILGGGHMVVQRQQHMSQTAVSQQQGNRLPPYQQQPQQQQLPPVEQPVQATSVPPLQQPQLLQSKSITSINVPAATLSYYQARSAVQQPSTSFAVPQMSPLQQPRLFMQPSQSCSVQNMVGAGVGASTGVGVSAGGILSASQQPDMNHQQPHATVEQAALQQQSSSHMVASVTTPTQSRLPQPVNYGAAVMAPGTITATITSSSAVGTAVAQNVASAGVSQQLDLSKQMGSGLSTPFQTPISSSPYDLYANLPKKQSSSVQQQQQTQMIQQPQQAKTTDVRQGCPDPCATTTPLLGRTLPSAGSGMQQQIGAAGVASSLQPSRQTAPAGLHHQAAASRAMQQQQQQQQQLSPSAQQAVAFAMGLPGTTSQFAQMQQQYLEQMYRSSMFQNGLLQAAAATSAYGGGGVAATGAYGSGYSGTPSNPTAGVLTSATPQNVQRQQQQQPHLADMHHQSQQPYLPPNPYQQPSPSATLCSPQQANIAAQQLMYSATGAFPIPCESPLLSTQQVNSQPGMYHAGIGQRHDVKQQPAKQQLQQQVKAYPSLPAASVIARYPVMWQGIIALKTNETRVQMHKVGGNAEMCKRSLDQFTTTSNHMPLIRINQRMRMETGQLESVQSKMMDEHSYIALVCLSCGPSKEDIKNQSEVLKERFVDYLESKQAAGICNVGNDQNPTPNSIVHIFPPCDFASTFLQKNSPDLLEIFRQQKASYLFVVITSAN